MFPTVCLFFRSALSACLDTKVILECFIRIKISSDHYNIVKEKITSLVPKRSYVASLEAYFSCLPEYNNLDL